MKKNALMLTLVAFLAGIIITVGLTRSSNEHFTKVEYCTDSTPKSLMPNLNCNTWQRGYPMQFLHSQISGETYNGTQVGKTAGVIWSNPWIEFRPAVADWLIWSLVSAGGIGLLVYLLERAGISTGFADKKRRR